MSRFRNGLLALALVAAAAPAAPARAGGDPASGERVFRKCAACHAIGIGAQNRVGPALNGLIGRKAASIADYGYSQAMINAGDGGLVWDEETLTRFLAHPKGMVEGTRMTFAGLKKEKEVEDVIAYLSAFAADGSSATAGPAEKAVAETVEKTAFVSAADAPIPAHGIFHLGRRATPDEVEAWDIDVRADGLGLPEGRGTVAEGEAIYAENCAVCHGDFGEAVGRWPVLAGGEDSLNAERPEKTIGSYWPYLSTVYDYVRRAMPFGNARGLSDDEVYALTAYLLYLNDVVKDENFALSRENFTSVRLPNEANFIADDRGSEAHYAAHREPCMTNCKAEPATITGRARVLDVTPESDDEEGRASVD
jgi:cytochrome c